MAAAAPVTCQGYLDTPRDAVRSVLQAQIDTLRKRGISWAQIGDALGVSRQAAWERFS